MSEKALLQRAVDFVQENYPTNSEQLLMFIGLIAARFAEIEIEAAEKRGFQAGWDSRERRITEKHYNDAEILNVACKVAFDKWKEAQK